MAIQFSNLASTSLASGVSSSATSVSVTSASLFPSLGGSDYFYATLSAGTGSEIVKVTAISGTTFTVIRGQDGTTAVSHSAGVDCALRVTAAALEDLRDATALTTSVAAKLPLAGGTLTGGLSGTTASFSSTLSSGAITSTGNSQFDGAVQIGDTVAQNAYGLLQVNQEANNDESGIGIFDSTNARSMRLWCDATSSYINSGNAGGGNLVLNEAITVSSGGNLTGVGTISSGTVTSSSGILATNTWFNNNQPATDNAVYSGYGVIGNRGNFYVTNGGGTVQIGNGNVHNSNPTATFSTAQVNLGANRTLAMNGQVIVTAARNLTNIGDVSLDAGKQLRLTKALVNDDFDAIRIAYTGSWSNYPDKIAGVHVVNANNDTATMGRFGITYGTSGGSFVITDLYDGGFGASGDVFRVRGNGDVEITNNFKIGSNTVIDASRNAVNLNAVGIGTPTVTSGYLLHLKSTGDAGILIEADSDNVTETDNAFIRFTQDGGAVATRVGHASGTNAFEIMHEYNDSLILGQANQPRLTITATSATFAGKIQATQLDLVGTDNYIAYGSAGTAPSNGDYLRLRDVATGNDALQFYMDSSKLFSIDGQTGNAYHKGTISSGAIASTGTISTTTGNYSTATSRNHFATPYGYIQLGPMNTTWAHIYTDRPAFYTNKDIYVLNQKVLHAGNYAGYSTFSGAVSGASYNVGSTPVIDASRVMSPTTVNISTTSSSAKSLTVSSSHATNAATIVVGNTVVDQTLVDGNTRPMVVIDGQYPVLNLNHTVTSNSNHGPTIQFTYDGLTTGGSTGRQVLIGTDGQGQRIDFGFSGGAYGGNSDKNPHNGISGYSGVTPMRLFPNGLLLGSTGVYPNEIASISHALDVRGTVAVGGQTVIDASRNATFADASIVDLLIGTVGTSSVYTAPSTGALYFGSKTNGKAYSINSGALENIGGNYTKLHINWHTGIKIGAAYNYGGIRFFNNSLDGYTPDMLFSIGNTDQHVRATNNFYSGGEIHAATSLTAPLYKVGTTPVIDASRNITGANITGAVITSVSAIGAADNVRTGLTHDDSTAMAAGVGGQLVLGYRYTAGSGGVFTEGAIIKMYKENGNTGEYGSGLKFQVRNHGANLSAKMTLDPSGNLTATGNVTAYSDERLKENIQTLDGKKVLQMRGVSFTKDGEAGSGVIAQELEKIAPELVHDGEYKSVAYGNITGYLIEAVKEQQKEIDELKLLVKQLLEK